MKPLLFDTAMFEVLASDARASERRRANSNVHQSLEDPIQRLFITLEPSSYVKPHRHSEKGKFEFFLLVSGKVLFFLFDDEGNITQKLEMCADGDIRGIEIPPETWHTIVAVDEPATFLEVKPGPYQRPDAGDFANWAPDEGDVSVSAFMQALLKGDIGTKVTP